MANHSYEQEFQRFQLHFAAMKGDLSKVTELVEAKYPLNRFDELGKTPLHYAVDRGRVAVIALLWASGANIDAHDEKTAGNTPLGDVAGRCSPAIANLLVEAGADPQSRGWMGITALDRAEGRTDSQGHAVYKILRKAVELRNSL